MPQRYRPRGARNRTGTVFFNQLSAYGSQDWVSQSDVPKAGIGNKSTVCYALFSGLTHIRGLGINPYRDTIHNTDNMQQPHVQKVDAPSGRSRHQINADLC